jgi:hypothetical protein
LLCGGINGCSINLMSPDHGCVLSDKTLRTN